MLFYFKRVRHDWNSITITLFQTALGLPFLSFPFPFLCYPPKEKWVYVRSPWAQFQLSDGKCQCQDIQAELGWTPGSRPWPAPWVSFTCSRPACETHPIWKSQSASPTPTPCSALLLILIDFPFSLHMFSLQYVAVMYNQNSFWLTQGNFPSSRSPRGVAKTFSLILLHPDAEMATQTNLAAIRDVVEKLTKAIFIWQMA